MPRLGKPKEGQTTNKSTTKKTTKKPKKKDGNSK